jgi:hypothetical protein
LAPFGACKPFMQKNCKKKFQWHKTQLETWGKCQLPINFNANYENSKGVNSFIMWSNDILNRSMFSW